MYEVIEVMRYSGMQFGKVVGLQDVGIVAQIPGQIRRRTRSNHHYQIML